MNHWYPPIRTTSFESNSHWLIERNDVDFETAGFAGFIDNYGVINRNHEFDPYGYLFTNDYGDEDDTTGHLERSELRYKNPLCTMFDI